MSPPSPPTSRPLAAVLILVLVAGLLSLWAAWPSTVISADAAPAKFSGARAVAALETVLEMADGPHPVGTPANARVKDEIARQLDSLGWSVERQVGVGCRAMRSCAEVENLVARLPGRGTGPAVVVASHTDSVPAAPGAGDDGIGIAVSLELARNLTAAKALERPVWLLLDEGEEMGLLGAELFTRRIDPASVGALVNLEARGTEGPSWFFEVSEGGGGLVSAYGRSVAMPTTSSVAYAVYRRMPNDTDLTVFKGVGIPGLGLAMIDGGARYHTPRDDLEHLSTAAVQRMGESTLALVRELASSPLPYAKKEAVFFDVGARWTVRWPAGWTLPLALLSLGIVAAASRRSWGPGAMAGHLKGFALPLGVLVGSGGAGWALLVFFETTGSFPSPFAPTLVWASLAAAAGGGGVSLLLCAWWPGKQPAGDVDIVESMQGSGSWQGLGVLGFFGVLGILVAILEPAASYPWILAAGVGGAGFLARSDRPAAGPLGASLALVLTLVALIRVLPVGLGPMGIVGSAVLSGWVLVPLVGLVRRGRWLPGAGFLVAAGIVALGTLAVPGSTYDEPQPVNLRYLVDGPTRTTRLALRTRGEIPAALAEAGDLGPLEFPGRPDDRARALSLPDDASLEGPSITVVDRTEESLRVRIRSRGAGWGLWVWPPDRTGIRSVEWPGVEEERRAETSSNRIALYAVPPEGVEVELTGALEGELVVVDLQLGLPGAAEGLAAARPDDAAPIGLGDLTEVQSRVLLEDLVLEASTVDEPEVPEAASVEEQSEPG